METTLNRELAATVLLEAMFTTDAIASEKYGISIRSVQRWRQKLGEGDPELVSLVAAKKALLDAEWAGQLPKILRQGFDALGKCYEAIQADPEAQKSPVVIHALAGALRICAEVLLTGKMIDAKLNRSAISNGDRYLN